MRTRSGTSAVSQPSWLAHHSRAGACSNPGGHLSSPPAGATARRSRASKRRLRSRPRGTDIRPCAATDGTLSMASPSPAESSMQQRGSSNSPWPARRPRADMHVTACVCGSHQPCHRQSRVDPAAEMTARGRAQCAGNNIRFGSRSCRIARLHVTHSSAADGAHLTARDPEFCDANEPFVIRSRPWSVE